MAGLTTEMYDRYVGLQRAVEVFNRVTKARAELVYIRENYERTKLAKGDSLFIKRMLKEAKSLETELKANEPEFVPATVISERLRALYNDIQLHYNVIADDETVDAHVLDHCKSTADRLDHIINSFVISSRINTPQQKSQHQKNGQHIHVVPPPSKQPSSGSGKLKPATTKTSTSPHGKGKLVNSEAVTTPVKAGKGGKQGKVKAAEPVKPVKLEKPEKKSTVPGLISCFGCCGDSLDDEEMEYKIEEELADKVVDEDDDEDESPTTTISSRSTPESMQMNRRPIQSQHSGSGRIQRKMEWVDAERASG